MELTALRNSFSVSISFNADKAADVAAIAVGKAVRNATRYVLDRAIADTRTVIDAGRKTRQVADAIAQSTAIRVEAAVEDTIVAPTARVKAAIATPVMKAFDSANDAVIDYLESTLVETASVIESLPMADTFDFEASLATVRDEIEAQSEIDAPLAEEKPKIIDGAIVSSAGVTNAIAVTEAVEEVKPKASSSLSKLIREEAAKH